MTTNAMKRNWDGPPKKPAIPAPKMRATRIKNLSTVSSGAGQFIRAAQKAGWRTVATMSTGPYVHANGVDFSPDAQSIKVNCYQGNRAVVGLWINRKDKWVFEFAYSQVTGQPMVKLTAKQMRAALTTMLQDEKVAASTP